MSNVLTTVFSSTGIALLAALVLLFFTASATLELKRSEAGVNGTIRRRVFGGALTVERVQLTGIRGSRAINSLRYGQVEFDTDKGTVKVTRLSVHKSQANQLHSGVERFLKDPNRDRIVLIQDAPLRAGKVFGYLLLCFSILGLSPVAGRAGLNFLSGLLFAAGFFLVPAVALIFYSASPMLELKREETGVDAMLHRRVLFGALTVERLELNGLRKAELSHRGWVLLLADQGQLTAARSTFSAAGANRLVEGINHFLEDDSQDSLVLAQGTRIGLGKVSGYLLLALFLLIVAYSLMPNPSPPEES